MNRRLRIPMLYRVTLLFLLGLVMAGCSNDPATEDIATEVIAKVTATPAPTATPVTPTATPEPTLTATPVPTDTPEPTATATATATPVPTDTAEPTATATPEPTATATNIPTPRPTLPPPPPTVPPTAPTFPETPIRTWNAAEYRNYLGQFRDSLRSFNSEMGIFQQTGKPGDCGTFLGWARLWIVQSPGYTDVPSQWWPLYYEWRSLLKQVADLTVEVRNICGGSGSGSVDAQPLIDFLSWAYPRSEQMVTEAAGIQ